MLRIVVYLFLNLAAIIQTQLEAFVTGDSFESINKYPHSAFLRIQCTDEDNIKTTSYICGSSILNQRILLTAAHCAFNCKSGTKVLATLGKKNRTRDTIRSVNKFLCHEGFNEYTLACDIALLSMMHPVELSKTISRVAIVRHPPYKESAMIAGWGHTNVLAQQTDKDIILKYIEKKLLKRSECKQLIGTLANGTFCVNNNNDDGYFTTGDSGSALVVRGYIQIGIVTGNIPQKNITLGMFTDVGYYYKWIERFAHALYCNTE